MFHKHKHDQPYTGNVYSVFQIIKYVVWVLAFILLLGALGIKTTVLLAGYAALLVGVAYGSDVDLVFKVLEESAL